VVVVVVVVVVVLVVVEEVQESHTLPAPMLVPPLAVQAASSLARCARVSVQSALVSHAISAAFEQVPAAVPSPGAGSLQTPVSVRQHSTTVSFPHVERAAHRASVRRVSAVRQPALRSAFRRWTTQLTYFPWFRQAATEPSGSIWPAHGHCSAMADTTSAGQVMGVGFPLPIAAAVIGRSSSAQGATIRVRQRIETSFGNRLGMRGACHPSAPEGPAVFS